MTADFILAIAGIVLGSQALFSFIQFWITRGDKKREAKADKTSKIDKNVTEMQKSITALADAVETLQKSVDQNNADMALQSEALMALAQDTILTKAREYKDRGFVYSDELANLHRLADAYRNLHGNGEVKIQMDVIDTLEVRIR